MKNRLASSILVVAATAFLGVLPAAALTPAQKTQLEDQCRVLAGQSDTNSQPDSNTSSGNDNGSDSTATQNTSDESGGDMKADAATCAKLGL